MATFLDLPTELLRKVVDSLAISDLKSLRHVGHHHNAVCIEYIYRQLHMSVLKHHLDAFCAIVARPHLAAAVRELIWEELDLESLGRTGASAVADVYRTAPSTRPYGNLDEDELRIYALVDDAKTDPAVFWLPRRPFSDAAAIDRHVDATEAIEYRNAVKRPLEESFWKTFCDGLGQLPSLTTLVSCPMPGHRLIVYRGYEIRVDVLLCTSDMEDHGNCSIGFGRFLSPAMALYPQLAHLYFSGVVTAWTWCGSQDLIAFRNLVSLDLCVVCSSPDFLHGLRHLFQATKLLRSLKLCFENHTDLSPVRLDFSQDWDRLESLELVDQVCKFGIRHENSVPEIFWPHLESLHLAFAELPDSFATFLGKHFATLRNVVLEECQVKFSLVKKMRRQRCLELSSFRILDSSSRRMAHAGQLLDYVNNKTKICMIDGERLSARYDGRFVTEQTIFDCTSCPTSAWFDSRQRPRLYSTDELREMQHAIPDYMLATSEQDLGQRMVIGAIGTVSDGNDNYDEGSDMDGVLEYKEYKDRQRRHYWDWCYHGGEWYWWPAESAEDAKTETTNWRFRHRDSTVAYGNDPLIFFDDWDSDIGDVAEPTPFGEAFDHARNNPASHTRAPPERATAWEELVILPSRTLSDESRPQPENPTNNEQWLPDRFAAIYREYAVELSESVTDRSEEDFNLENSGMSD
ncbi:F-box and leucine-rich repeat protein 2/20 [Microdochium nivale]|nr:F-box and leucine-rich repeat protein 2/20 [Microdochium nivale]